MGLIPTDKVFSGRKVAFSIMIRSCSIVVVVAVRPAIKSIYSKALTAKVGASL